MFDIIDARCGHEVHHRDCSLSFINCLIRFSLLVCNWGTGICIKMLSKEGITEGKLMNNSILCSPCVDVRGTK